jgi:hypothetical protein
MSERTLTDADVEAIARCLAELLESRPVTTAAPLVDVRRLAAALGVGRDFVYEHAVELGGVKLTASPKSPWRFDVERARRAMADRAAPTPVSETSTRRPGARRRPPAASAVKLLPIRGAGA